LQKCRQQLLKKIKRNSFQGLSKKFWPGPFRRGKSRHGGGKKGNNGGAVQKKRGFWRAVSRGAADKVSSTEGGGDSGGGKKYNRSKVSESGRGHQGFEKFPQTLRTLFRGLHTRIPGVGQTWRRVVTCQKIVPIGPKAKDRGVDSLNRKI